MGGPNSPRGASWPPQQSKGDTIHSPRAANVPLPFIPPLWGPGGPPPPSSEVHASTGLIRADPLAKVIRTTGDAQNKVGSPMKADWQQPLDQFTKSIEDSLLQLVVSLQGASLPANQGKTPAGSVAMDGAIINSDQEEYEKEQESDKLVKQKEFAAVVGFQGTRPGRSNAAEGAEHSSSESSVSSIPSQEADRLKKANERISLQKITIDTAVRELVLEPPRHSFLERMSEFEFNAKSLYSKDSFFHRVTQSTGYSCVRGVAVIADTAFILAETSYSTTAVANREKHSNDDVHIFFESAFILLWLWFCLDQSLAMALEFPRFDMFVGRTGYRFLNLLAILQQTLVFIADFTFPNQRYTSWFRAIVHQFSFLRVFRTLVTLPGMGGKKMQQSIGEFYIMIRAVVGTFRPLIWCSLLCTFMIMIFGIFLAEGAAARISRRNSPTEVFPEDSPQAHLLADWGGVERCMYSLLLSMLGGADWGDLFSSLVGYGEPVAASVCFLFFICFTFVALLNTVTAVFIQCAFVGLEKDRAFTVQRDIQAKRDYLVAAQELFEQLDTEEEGSLNCETLKKQLENHEVRAGFQRLCLDTDQVEKLFLLMDRDGSGRIALDEFMTGCLRLKGEARRLNLELLHNDVKFVLDSLGDIVTMLQSQKDILQTPRNEPPSTAKQVHQLHVLQRGMRLLSRQLHELDITVQNICRQQPELELEPELEDDTSVLSL